MDKEDKVTPYDTGKVKIGIAYQPKPRPVDMDTVGDGERLQSALLLRAHISCTERLRGIVRRVLGV